MSTIRILPVAVVWVGLAAVWPAVAADFGGSDLTGPPIVVDAPHPLLPQQITQNSDPWTLEPGSISCVGSVTLDTGWWRLFDLDVDHLLFGQFCVESIDYAVEAAIGPEQNLTVRLYCLDDGSPFILASLTEVGSRVIPQPDVAMEYFNIEIDGCCDSATQSMAVEFLSDDCAETGTCQQMFIGSNSLPQTKEWYIMAPDCSVDEPLSTAGWADDSRPIMVINGEDESQPGGEVPAVTRPGIALLALVLFLLGCACVLRRRLA